LQPLLIDINLIDTPVELWTRVAFWARSGSGSARTYPRSSSFFLRLIAWV